MRSGVSAKRFFPKGSIAKAEQTLRTGNVVLKFEDGDRVKILVTLKSGSRNMKDAASAVLRLADSSGVYWFDCQAVTGNQWSNWLVSDMHRTVLEMTGERDALAAVVRQAEENRCLLLWEYAIAVPVSFRAQGSMPKA